MIELHQQGMYTLRLEKCSCLHCLGLVLYFATNIIFINKGTLSRSFTLFQKSASAAAGVVVV